MKIGNLFQKEITRDIQGVIKIGQTELENIHQELEEYVVTKELQGHFKRFFEAYTRSLTTPTDKMGVWISGFFGSGKSHFLKILAYLLDSNIQINGKSSVDFFESKIIDKNIFEKMKQAHVSPSDVILFNIDSKSETDNKQNKQAIVKVFNKVFNEMLGYSASIPWLAELEDTLDKNGEYLAFKAAFKTETSMEWEEGRDELYYNLDETIRALINATNMTEESARSWIENGEKNYSISVESFAKRLKTFVESKEDKQYKLIFAVDEIGQFIAGNVQLMLNLQTLVEDLGKLTNGRVWVLVTSQQDIDSMKADISANDFSKIQGRFNVLLSLSSANADEVIKKRLLEKNEPAEKVLELTYEEYAATLKNKIDFENTTEMPNYKSTKDFVQVYPFIPYQFLLLQKVFTAIREHGSAGKHLADGERSLLECIQKATVAAKNEEIKQLISFDSFYMSVEQVLEHSVRGPIGRASENERLTPFDLRVLKVLFLIRYVDEIPATLKNLSVLFISKMDEDMLLLSKQIEQSLTRLEKEFLIQRSNDVYVFLTNEEQDINREINRMEVQNSELVTEVGKVIFDTILDLRKFVYRPFEDNKNIQYEIALSSWIDERVLGGVSEKIGIKILTAYSAYQEPEEFAGLSISEDKVIVALPENFNYGNELEILKINAFIKNHATKPKTIIIDEILRRKAANRSNLSQKVIKQLEEALEKATIFVNGSILQTRGTGKARVLQSLTKLVENKYAKLNYINKYHKTEDLENLLKDKQMNFLTGNNEDANILATNDIQKTLQNNATRSKQITIKELFNKLSLPPFGWREEDIIASLIRLSREEQINFISNGSKLVFQDLELKQLTNRASQERMLVTIREVIPIKFIQSAKLIMEDIFQITALGDKEDEMLTNIKAKFNAENDLLKNLLTNYKSENYPQESDVKEGIRIFGDFLEINDAVTFFKEIANREEQLLAYGEAINDLKLFFSGSQKTIFDDAIKQYKNYNRDKNFLNDENLELLMKQINEILKMSMPYTRIKELPELTSQFKDLLLMKLEAVATPILEQIELTTKEVIQEMSNLKESESLRTGFLFKMENLKTNVSKANQLGSLISFEHECDAIKLNNMKLIQQLREKQQVQEEKQLYQAETSQGDTVIKEKLTPLKKREIIMTKKDLCSKKTIVLESEQDIDNYLAEIKLELLNKLQEVEILKLV
ncbi:BREX system P-loop protein BrxC [Listeria seeligeri]|uniref:BREX system P-loop protein BrxC n=1 Tax=Listeria seeligeri TaxID=1640 RepID=UPI0016282A6D|nr:BREX system P-loop protein BrxC [Listeria seeligeri]MBC1471665.1 BREX system P-loop protein BrxC [Listeria seeligeri]